jgi:hypothetical protein
MHLMTGDRSLMDRCGFELFETLSKILDDESLSRDNHAQVST